MRNLEKPACFEKTLLAEGEPLSFPLYSLTPDGKLKEREIETTIKGFAEGGFRGDVYFLQDEPSIVKTNSPTANKYFIPYKLLRAINEGFGPFLPQQSLETIRCEYVLQKILRLTIHGYFGNKYYLPDTEGYTYLGGIGYVHLIEEIADFRASHLPEEIERIFQAQEELTEFCRRTGLIELAGQIHPKNPLAPANLVFLKDGTICWLDIHPGIKMRWHGLVFPVPIPYAHHIDICRQTQEEGEKTPTFNKIHVKKLTKILNSNEDRRQIESNIGPEGYQELRKWLALYGSLLTDYDEMRTLSRREQWQRAWREAPEVAGKVVDKIEEYPELYLLARIFGIRTAMFLLDKEYRQWALDLPVRVGEKWERIKTQESQKLREEERIGPHQQLETVPRTAFNWLARRTPLFPVTLQRLINDPEFRSLSKLAGFLILSGMRNAQKEKVLNLSDLQTTEEQFLQLTSRRVAALLLTAIGHHAISRGADFFEITSYLSAIIAPENWPVKVAIGITGGWVAPVAARLAFTKATQLAFQEEMKTAFTFTYVPKLGHYVATPAQLAIDLGNPQITEYLIRDLAAKITSVWPTGGWGTRLELRAWGKIHPTLEKMLRGGYPILERIEASESAHSLLISLFRERPRGHS